MASSVDQINQVRAWTSDFQGQAYVHLQQTPSPGQSKRRTYCWLLNDQLEPFRKTLNRVGKNPQIADPDIIHNRANGFRLQFVRLSKKTDEKGELYQLQVVPENDPPIATITLKDLKSFMNMIRDLLGKHNAK